MVDLVPRMNRRINGIRSKSARQIGEEGRWSKKEPVMDFEDSEGQGIKPDLHVLILMSRER